MRGISEKWIKDTLSAMENNINYPGMAQSAIVLKVLLDYCYELNDWKPIDSNTPRNIPFLLYFPSERAPFYDVTELRFTGTGDFKPTHYKELTPPPPEK